MDTKWKKSKIMFSFSAFFLGMTLLVGSLTSLADVLAGTNGEVLRNKTDYQDSAAFRSYVSEQLENFLGVATGGKGWKNYGVLSGDSYSFGNSEYWMSSDEIVQEMAEEYAYAKELAGEATVMEGGSVEQAIDTDRSWNGTESRDEYMEAASYNRNLRYAIIYQNKLLYTNIEKFANKTGTIWNGMQRWKDTDYSTYLKPEDYNFSLWYNRKGDGKTEIEKDGEKEDIYGNGVYTPESRWFVPGYTNFNVDASAKDVVIFIAVAKEPKLYVRGNYSEYGTLQCGGKLYSMQEDFQAAKKQFKISVALLAASVLLLGLAFAWRKEKRQADWKIAVFFRKIWLELKLLVFLLLLMAALKRMFLPGIFWLFYLLILDLRVNKGMQKKSILDSLKNRNFHYPIQKRLVRRAFVPVFTGILALVLYHISWFLLGAFMYSHRDILRIAVFVTGILLLTGVGVNCFYLKKTRRLAEDFGALADHIRDVRNGNLTEPLELSVDTDLKEVAENLNQIQCGLEQALREQISSERMKVDLVTNVSHDIKTPLTSIISYVELLKQEENLPDHVREFIRILGEKSERLKTIVQDVFEISKATSGQLPVKMEELDLGKLLRQTLADMDTQIEKSGLSFRVSISEEAVYIWADGQRLYRVFQNLIQNALKYSLTGSRVYLTMTADREEATVCIQNISGRELEHGMDFTERFVRGDASRTDGGSGLGLSIARSFTEACGGSFQIKIDADLFTVIVKFPQNLQEWGE